MTPRERVLAAVSGQPIDRVPFSLWYHFRLDPAAGSTSAMGREELKFYHLYRPDFLKVMHDIDYEPMPPIVTTQDWKNLRVLNPEAGNFGKQLETLREIRAGLGPDVLMIDTLFGVHNYAEKLSGKKLAEHLRMDPDAVHDGLRNIAASLEAYAKAAVSAGCDGVYYALTGASEEGLTPMEYTGNLLEYDRQVLNAVANAPFVVLHLHGYRNLYFDMTCRLPATAVCWSDRAGGPSIAEARKVFSGCVIGGLDETIFDRMTEEAIVEQARNALHQNGELPFILAPGCAIPTDTDPNLICAIGRAVGA